MKEVLYISDFVGNFRLLNFATGSYSCICAICNKHFIGDKYATQCLACALESATSSIIVLEDIIKNDKKIQGQTTNSKSNVICTGCLMESCNKSESSRCKTCSRFYPDNYQAKL
jgi:hypothetical protein